MLEAAFQSSIEVAKDKMASGIQLEVDKQIIPLYDSFETQHFGKSSFKEIFNVLIKY